MISVLLVDDHAVVREGMTAVLSSEPDIEVVGQAASAEEAMALVRKLTPDVVVLDVRLPGVNGSDAAAAVLRQHSRARVVVITSFPNDRIMLEAFTAGARAFLTKESDPTLLRTAVRTVMSGGTYIDPTVASKLVTLATKGRRTKGPFGLTLQEMRVLEHLPKGLTNREIGRELGISEQTVKTHLQHAMTKLGVHDRSQAAAVAIREGLT
jgi:DNA-binding NarL/FixJ family response regulator